MVLCGTWSETSVTQSQLTQFWQIPRHRTLSYSLWTPFFFTTTPCGGTWKYAKAPSKQKQLGEILYLLICSFLPCLSWLLRSRVRKSRRDLWITLYKTVNLYLCLNTSYTDYWTFRYGRNKQWGVIRGATFIITGRGDMSSRPWPLVLLIKVGWRQDSALRSEKR